MSRALAVDVTDVLVAYPPDRDGGTAVIPRAAKPYEARPLRLLFSAHYTHGHFIATLNCGIKAGLGPLWENEGIEVVTGCLDSIWEDPASRPGLIF